MHNIYFYLSYTGALQKMSATVTAKVYDNKNMNVVRFVPLRGITTVVGDTFKSICHGWQDCREAAADWWEMLQQGDIPADEAEVFATFYVNPLFTSLGRPMENADDYRTPWDDFLATQQYREDLAIALRGWNL